MIERLDLSRRIREEGSSTIIDIHTHCGSDHINYLFRRYPTSQNVKDLVLKLRQSGVDFAVTFPCPGGYYYFDFPSLAQNVTFTPHPAEDFPYQVANRQLFYEVSLFGEDKIIPFPMIFPDVDDSKQIDNLNELGQQDRLFGLKLHTLATHTPSIRLLNSEYMEIAERYDVPMLIHTGPDEYSRPEQVVELAKSHPSVRFCIAHAGRFEQSLFDLLGNLKSENLFFDTSPFISLCKLTLLNIKRGIEGKKLPLTYENPREALLQLYRYYPQGILWGTDEPWTTITDDSQKGILTRVDYSDEKDLLLSLPLEDKERIAFLNAVRFLFGN